MARPRPALPTGTLTFLFSDIEDSTRLVEELGAAGYRELLEQHQRLLRSAFAGHGGIERSTEGDSFFVVFLDAPAAIAAAVDGQRKLSDASWPNGRRVRVRMGLHSGEGIAGGDDYVGIDVHRAARIAAAAHGGQVIVSESTRALSHHALPSDVGFTDLGEYRLKGLAHPERLFQVSAAGMPSSFPPPRTERVARAHLPPRLTSFVGRQSDLDVLDRLLGDNRLVTLVGPGGTGKTSLAVECARERSGDFLDGAWFVALETISDASLVASAIVGALGLQDPSGRSARDQLEENLVGRELLLLLDNFEQVMPATDLIGGILTSAPEVRILATSRAPMHLTAEQVYPVAPLPIPSIEQDGVGSSEFDAAKVTELGAVPSVRLFVDRAGHVQPGFQLSVENAAAVAEICARLDGLPLGIELAAARVPLLGVSGVAERLARQVNLPTARTPEVPARQRTLRETIAWSHELVATSGQALFARLSVFAGGCRFEEAEVVCGPVSEPGSDVLETLGELVDQSLVVARERAGGIRYEMLETIRQFAADRLAGRQDGPTLRRRHALAYLALAEAIAPQIRGRGRAMAFERIGPERDNLRAALQWSFESGDVDVALRLATTLVTLRGAPPWGMIGAIQEARSAIVSALELPGAQEPTLVRMRALEAAGTSFYYSADNARAASFYRAQLALANELADARGAADAQYNLAWTEDWTDRLDEANAWRNQVEAAYAALGDERGLARVMFSRGTLLVQAGRQTEAIEVFQRAIERLHELDDVAYESMTAGSIGRAYLELGDRDAGIHWLVRGVVGIAREVDDEGAMTMTLPIGAIAALELGRPEAAAVIMGASESLTRGYGIRPPASLQQVFGLYDPLARAKAELDPATFEAALQRGREMRLDQVVALVLEMDPAPPQ